MNMQRACQFLLHAKSFDIAAITNASIGIKMIILGVKLVFDNE
jgi:hypothetical protein